MGKQIEMKYGKLDPILTLELCKAWDGRKLRIVALVSRPGIEGTFSRSWSLTSGIPDAHQAVDMSHWVLLTVKRALEGSTGIQGSIMG